ncbi:MAG: hypothetical protein ACK5Q5_01900 [Planctomycetaceae bacterium]
MMNAPVRLFSPEPPQDQPPGDQHDSHGDPRRQYKLRHCYELYLLPEHQQHGTPATVRQYNAMLKHWERLLGDPDVCLIDQALADDWQKKRAAEAGSLNTVDKESRMLTTLWTRIGPYHPRGSARLAKEIIPRVPYLRPLATSRSRTSKRALSAEQWSRLYAGCRSAWFSLDERVPGPFAWRCWAVLLFSLGLRHGDLFDLPWRSIYLHTHCPVAGWESTQWEHGWVWIQPTKTRRHAKEIIVPLPQVARLHLDRLRSLQRSQSVDQTVLPLGGDAKSKVQNEVIRQINRDAGLTPAWLCQELRVSANVAWERAKPSAGEWLLGHASCKVNREHYQVGIPTLMDAARSLEIPSAFLAVE